MEDEEVLDLTAMRPLERGTSSSVLWATTKGSDVFALARQALAQIECDYHARKAILNACEAELAQAKHAF
jgi:glutamate synthase domain-containing protein 2